MKLKTVRGEIKTVAARWNRAYKHSTDTVIVDGKTKSKIGAELMRIDVEMATAEDIKVIIGNSSWIELRCDECGECCESVMQLGQEPDYESCTADICFSCLKSALDMMDIKVPA